MMSRLWISGLRAAAPVALVCLLPAVAPAQTVENPPSFSAKQIGGIPPAGSNYTINFPVRSNGMLRVYRLTTPYGEFTVIGDAMMRMRVNELTALAALEKVSNSNTFRDALVQAGLSPLKYTGKLITNPVGTVQDTFSGIGAMFDRIGAGLAGQGQTPDKPLASLLGVTDARRKLAAQYGVDPYTDFPPLDAKLKQLAEAATAGGLVVSGALMAVPGAAGIVVSNLSTANKLNNVGLDQLARDYTAAQILALNKQRLIAMDIHAGIERPAAGEPRFHPDRYVGNGCRPRQHERGGRSRGVRGPRGGGASALSSLISCAGRRSSWRTAIITTPAIRASCRWPAIPSCSTARAASSPWRRSTPCPGRARPPAA